MSPRRRLSPFEQIPAIGDGGLVLSKSDLVRRRARLVARRRRRAELDTAVQYRDQVRRKLETTFPTATAAVKLLEGSGILSELTGQKKNRSFS